jgi:hypothetical protein
MALVLWQPPKPRLIPNPEPEEDDGNNNNNNGESIDLNNMPTYVELKIRDFSNSIILWLVFSRFSNILEPSNGLEVQDDVEMEAL